MEASSNHSGPDALSLQLRTATRAAHEALESTAFSRRLSEGALDLPSYARYLNAMWHFHSLLEAAAAASQDSDVATVWRDDMRRASALEADLSALERGGLAVDRGTDESVPAMAFSSLMYDEKRDQKNLIGMLYVAEGSRLGGRVLRKSLLARHPHLKDAGLMYLQGYGDRSGQQWVRFRARLDALTLGPVSERVVIEGAAAAFRAIQGVFAQL